VAKEGKKGVINAYHRVGRKRLSQRGETDPGYLRGIAAFARNINQSGAVIIPVKPTK